MINTDKIIPLPLAFSLEIAEVQDRRPPHVLICIHGIRDDGAWCDVTATAMGEFLDSTVEIVCARYDRVSSYGFILGCGRAEIRDDVVDQIKFIKQSYPDSQLSVLAHSNGTKIITEIISEFDFKFEWVFLCGSVCHIRDVNELRQVSRTPINDAGTKDWWPIIAEALRPSLFGATGVNGFHRFPVRDRTFAYYHGQGTTEGHIRDWVLPTLVTGRIRRTAAIDVGFKKHLPTYVRYALTFFPVLVALAWFIPLWITAAFLALGWAFALKHILQWRWFSTN